MENRVEKYKLNAKKAYQFAARMREIVPGRNKTRLRYKKWRGRQLPIALSDVHGEEKIELTHEEQMIFLGNLEYACKYSRLFNKRFDFEIEQKILESTNSPSDIKYAIEYCKHFEIAAPSGLHNRILILSAMPTDKTGLSYVERYKVDVAERKQKRYLKNFQEQKKSFKLILESLIKENNLTENSTIKDLLNSINN